MQAEGQLVIDQEPAEDSARDAKQEQKERDAVAAVFFGNLVWAEGSGRCPYPVGKNHVNSGGKVLRVALAGWLSGAGGTRSSRTFGRGFARCHATNFNSDPRQNAGGRRG